MNIPHTSFVIVNYFFELLDILIRWFLAGAGVALGFTTMFNLLLLWTS